MKSEKCMYCGKGISQCANGDWSHEKGLLYTWISGSMMHKAHPVEIRITADYGFNDNLNTEWCGFDFMEELRGM